MPYQTSNALDVARSLAYLDASLKLIDGDLTGAATTVHLQRCLSATLDEYPSLGARLDQVHIDSMAARTVENALLVGEFDDRALSALMDVVEDRLAAATMKWVFLGECAQLTAAFDSLAAEGLQYRTPPVTGDEPWKIHTEWFPRMLARHNQIRGVEMLTRLVNAADGPRTLGDAVQRYEGERPEGRILLAPLNLALPRLSRAMELHHRNKAELRCIDVVLSAERFRLARGRLPGSLSELVPQYLDGLPTDPFDGQPLRLATNEKGILIYSIGDNLTDDGGDVAYREDPPDYRDVGFRLFKPEHRGLLLTDEPPPSDD